MKQCLNIGSGKSYRVSNSKEKWINLDINTDWKPDIIHNLIEFPYPFKDNQFDFIEANNILEHFTGEELLKVLKELGRITNEKGYIWVRVPHHSSSSAYQIYHKLFFHIEFFNKLNIPIVRVLDKKLVLSENRFMWLLNKIANINPYIWERFFCYYYPIKMVEFKIRVNNKIKNNIR